MGAGTVRRVEHATPHGVRLGNELDNFWDGRARHDFNGGSVFAPPIPRPTSFAARQGEITATRQVIRFASLGLRGHRPALSESRCRSSVATGPSSARAAATRRDSFGQSRVATNDTSSAAGPNQGGSAAEVCRRRPSGNGNTASASRACASDTGLDRESLLHHRAPSAKRGRGAGHLNGCYTDGNAALHPNQCAPGVNDRRWLCPESRAVGGCGKRDKVHPHGSQQAFSSACRCTSGERVLVPDDTPFDQFLDRNPDMFASSRGERPARGDQRVCGVRARRNGTALHHGQLQAGSRLEGIDSQRENLHQRGLANRAQPDPCSGWTSSRDRTFP